MVNNITPFPGATGFQGQLSGTNIVDLIQLNCMSRAAAAYEVQSGAAAGVLVFEGGEIVHAAVGDEAGEDALRQILAWKNGRFNPCQLPQPLSRTLRGPWQSVLLRLAQESDEEARSERVTTPPTSAPATPRETLETALRVSFSGTLQAAKGRNQEALADTVAYVTNLAHILGAELGLGSPTALDFSTEDERTLAVRREPSGSWLALLGGTAQVRSSLERVRKR